MGFAYRSVEDAFWKDEDPPMPTERDHFSKCVRRLTGSGKTQDEIRSLAIESTRALRFTGRGTIPLGSLKG